jgi:AraC family transcriptional regulator
VTGAEIREFGGKTLSGLRRRMSVSDDQTSELWREFRQRQTEIRNRVGAESYSVKVYGSGYSFSRFDPHAIFDKWAAVEISEQYDGPFEALEISSGIYAVFLHVGPAANAAATFGYIFRTWLPNSEIELDRRPHFEVLPPNYDPFDSNAEEEIWIPVKLR